MSVWMSMSMSMLSPQEVDVDVDADVGVDVGVDVVARVGNAARGGVPAVTNLLAGTIGAVGVVTGWCPFFVDACHDTSISCCSRWFFIFSWANSNANSFNRSRSSRRSKKRF